MAKKRSPFKLRHRRWRGEWWKELIYATKGRGRVIFRFPASESKNPEIVAQLQAHMDEALGRRVAGV